MCLAVDLKAAKLSAIISLINLYSFYIDYLRDFITKKAWGDGSVLKMLANQL